VRDRFNGYAAALSAAGIELDESLVTHGNWSAESGAAMMRKLLERDERLDAVFACSDVMAIAAIEELHAHGRSVPGDVAVVGYDDALIASTAILPDDGAPARSTDRPPPRRDADPPVANRRCDACLDSRGARREASA